MNASTMIEAASAITPEELAGDGEEWQVIPFPARSSSAILALQTLFKVPSKDMATVIAALGKHVRKLPQQLRRP